MRRDLEAKGEQEVRDDVNFRRGLGPGGETTQEFVRKWLRGEERKREARERRAQSYLRWTLWVAAATLLAAVVVPFLVPLFVHP